MATSSVRFRSKYPEYTLAGIRFHNHVSPPITDTALIERCRAAPEFGHDFWVLDDAAEAKAVAEAAAVQDAEAKSNGKKK